MSGNVIRDPDFAKRLDLACDQHPLVPAKHHGRQSWIVRELNRRFGTTVSRETARKWFAGEAKPRPDKLAQLAHLLDKDVAWLSLGVDVAVSPRERRLRDAMADGAVNLIAGLMQMDGASVAFPNDKGANGQQADLHAIIKGAKYDLHISVGAEENGGLRFAVPVNYEGLVVLGVKKRGFQVSVLEIRAEEIERGQSRGGTIEVMLSDNEMESRWLGSFADRL